MISQRALYIVIIGLLAIGVFATIFQKSNNKDSVSPRTSVANFEECASAGNPVMESHPRKCRSADGQLFVEVLPPQEQPPEGQPVAGGACVVGGCSGEICGEASEVSGMITTCEFRAEYACYRSARCERQADKKCGWTETAELKSCRANPPAL